MLQVSAGGLLVQAAYLGDGWYEVRLQPFDEVSDSSTYQLALLAETLNTKGVKADTNYKAWLGASVSPYAESKLTFEPVWGGVPSQGGGTSRKAL